MLSQLEAHVAVSLDHVARVGRLEPWTEIHGPGSAGQARQAGQGMVIGILTVAEIVGLKHASSSCFKKHIARGTEG